MTLKLESISSRFDDQAVSYSSLGSFQEAMYRRASNSPGGNWDRLANSCIFAFSSFLQTNLKADESSCLQCFDFKCLSDDGATLILTKRDKNGVTSEVLYKETSENPIIKQLFRLLLDCRAIYQRAVTRQATDRSQPKASPQAVSAARAKLEGIRKNHKSKFVNKCWNVVQTSDQIAIYRNVAKVFITAAAAIVMGLAAAGIVSSGALFLIAAGAAVCTFLGVSVFFGTLVSMKKISLKTAITHTLLLTLIASISYFTAIVFQASWTLTALYAVSVIVQGALFFGPQGLGAFGKGYYDKYQIAREAGDEKHKVTAALGVTSGVMSAAEGLAWTFLGVLMLATSCPWMKDLLEIILHNSGLAAQVLEMGGDMIKYTNWILYFGIFNVGYIFGIISAYNDWCIQSNFYKQLTEWADLNSLDILECHKCLCLIRNKMTGKGMVSEEKLTKKQLRLFRVVDEEVYDLLTIENIDCLLNILRTEDSNRKGEAEAVSRLLIGEVIAANQKNQKTAQLQLAIAVAGLIIGTALSMGGEFVTSAAAHAVNIADCSFWALINFGFFAVDSEMIKLKTERDKNRLKDIRKRLEAINPQ
jgi:hypothetical protein